MHGQPSSKRPLRRWIVAIAALSAATVIVWGVWALSQTRDADYNPVQVVPPFRPITEFPVKAVRDVGDALNPSELVLGVVVGNEARAYPINMLTGPQREILNDTLGGRPIAATW